MKSKGDALMKDVYFKLICESVSPLEKAIHTDVNLKDLHEIFDYMTRHPEQLSTDKTWVIYPMPLC